MNIKKFLIIAAIICVAVYMFIPLIISFTARLYMYSLDSSISELRAITDSSISELLANTDSSLQNINTYEKEPLANTNSSLPEPLANAMQIAVASAIEKQINDAANTKYYSTYQEACKNNDFDAAHDKLDAKRKEYAEALAKFKGWNNEKYFAARDLYYEAFDYIYKNEVQFILINFKDEECRDKIQFLLTDIPVIGEKRDEGLCLYYEASADYELGKYIHAYKTWVEHFNRICNTVLTLAINRQYKSTARMALLQILDNMQITRGGDDIKVDGIPVDGKHGYVKYVGTDRMEAKRKFDEAVELGAFE